MAKQKIIINANESYEISYPDGNITFQQWTEQLFRWMSIQKNLSKDAYVKVASELSTDQSSPASSDTQQKNVPSGTLPPSNTYTFFQCTKKIYNDKELALKIMRLYYEGDWNNMVKLAQNIDMVKYLLTGTRLSVHVIPKIKLRYKFKPQDLGIGLTEWKQKQKFVKNISATTPQKESNHISTSKMGFNDYPQLNDRAKLLEVYANYLSYKDQNEALNFVNTIGLSKIYKNSNQFYAMLWARAKRFGISSQEVNARAKQLRAERGQA